MENQWISIEVELKTLTFMDVEFVIRSVFIRVFHTLRFENFMKQIEDVKELLKGKLYLWF